MNDVAWRQLGRRFPQVPASFRMEVRHERSRAATPHNYAVIALAFSPDGRSIAASGGGRVPGAVDIRVYDVETHALTRICHAHSMGVFRLAFDPRTGLLASASHDYSVILWDLEQEDAIFLLGGPDANISRSDVGFCGTRIVVADGVTFAGKRATLTTIDLDTGETRTLLEVEGDLGFSDLNVLRDAGLLVVAIKKMRLPGDPEIRVLGLDGHERARFAPGASLYDLAAVDASTLIASGSNDDDDTIVFVVDLTTGARIAARTLGSETGASLAVAPERDRVAIAYHHGVELCAIDTLAPALRFDLDGGTECAVAWSPDGASIAVGTAEGTLRLFDARTGRELRG